MAEDSTVVMNDATSLAIPLQGDERKQLTVEDNKEIVKVYGECLQSGDIRISCTGEVDSGDADPPFDYVGYQYFRILKKKFEKLGRRIRLANGLRVDQVDDMTNKIISVKIQTEFGPMETFSVLYKGYHESYKRETLRTLASWAKEEEKLKYSKFFLKTKQDEIKVSMDTLLKSNPSFQSFRDVLNLEHIDWLQFPRPNFAHIDVRNTSFIDKVIADGCKVLYGLINPPRDQFDPDLAVVVLPNTKTNPLNLVFFDPMISFPSEILFDQEKISEEEARQLKSVMISYPNGVSVENYLSTYTSNYGVEPNYEAFGTFVNMCESLVDIFLFSDEIFPGRRLLFPAYWLGLLKPMNIVKAKMWHCIKFVINFNGGSILCDEILPMLKDVFNLDITPFDWGFCCDCCEEDFFCALIEDICPNDYYRGFDQDTKKYKIYNNKTRETKMNPYLSLTNEQLIERVTG